MYTYINSEPGLWTTGFRKPDGKWYPESDHSSPHDAHMRAIYLNGKAGTYVYITSETGPDGWLWTVGYYASGLLFHPVSDHRTQEEAAQETANLNNA